MKSFPSLPIFRSGLRFLVAAVSQRWRSRGVRLLAIALISMVSWLGGSLSAAAIALPTATPAAPTEVVIHLGTAPGELRFDPDHLTFSVGQRYKLILDNPSPEKHYFTAKDFADAIWTQKVQAGPVEVKGAIHELELQPTGVAEWVFVPQKPGVYELYCSIPGHREAGMRGTITVRVS